MDRSRTRSSFWVKILRFVAYVTIVCGCLVSLIAGVGIALGASSENQVAAVVVGILIFLFGTFLSLVGSASIMVFLDMANDLRAIRGQMERRTQGPDEY